MSQETCPFNPAIDSSGFLSKKREAEAVQISPPSCTSSPCLTPRQQQWTRRMSFIGEEGGKGGRSSNGREEEVRRRLEEGRRADQDGRRASGEKERASKGDGRSDGSQVSNELRGRSEQKSGSVAVSKLGGREVAPRKDDKRGRGGGEEQLRRVPYLQVSNQNSSDKLCKCALFSLLLLLQAVRQLTGSQGLDRDLCHQVSFLHLSATPL